ncbi:MULTISPECIES: hypothetical protein [Brucella]|uniref:hypothetical protein n=1 Tax=Brucella TaxID=234 RepID=UPI000F65A641|nr:MULTISPECIES: hypothetical protein [Brucella]KAB2748877.1 hypothetical protein F9L05_10450 [Brucella anthropi]RRY16323.1 hypothetical protein EGJ57_21835 [Brucella anthropi]UYT55059.1 hypothetical protein OHI65_02470 [Brucella sp. MAB-22]
MTKPKSYMTKAERAELVADGMSENGMLGAEAEAAEKAGDLARVDDEESRLEQLWQQMDADVDDGRAAREHLAAGFPIYYREADTPEGLEIKKYPDGRRELVRFHRAGDEVIRAL